MFLPHLTFSFGISYAPRISTNKYGARSRGFSVHKKIPSNMTVIFRVTPRLETMACGFLAVVSRPLLAHCFSLCDLRLFVIERMLLSA
jgi:hypothetical protein